MAISIRKPHGLLFRGAIFVAALGCTRNALPSASANADGGGTGASNATTVAVPANGSATKAEPITGTEMKLPVEAKSGVSPSRMKILFLHHSTGEVIWKGGVLGWFASHNERTGSKYFIEERAFPSGNPYPWDNYPYDYWNIWVNHAGTAPFMGEPTLETLTKQYQVIVWKHCFPSSEVKADTGNADVSSKAKTTENYKLQYAALKKKMREFPDTRFIVWTGAALVERATNAGDAARANAFFTWVTKQWDEPGDNIYVWDFRRLETGGGLYLLPENAASSDDSHPNAKFAARAAPLFAQRIVDVIEGRGDTSKSTGSN